MNRSSAMIAVFSAAAIGVYMTCPRTSIPNTAMLQQAQEQAAAEGGIAVSNGGAYMRYGRSRWGTSGSTASAGVNSVHSGFGSAGVRSAAS